MRSDRSPRAKSTPDWALRAAVATAAIGAWTYLGYPLLIRLAARRRRRPPREVTDHDLPTMTVVVPAHDEEATLPAKLDDLRGQDYPPDKLDVIVADDGSQDRTAAVAAAGGARVVRRADRVGKRDAINRGIEAATGTLVCLNDARNRLAPGALRRLAAAFDDERVSVVSGSNRIGGTGVQGEGEGLYWRIESGLKTAESAFGCTMGADGGVVALRRDRVRPIPAGVLSDDFFVALDAMRRGDLVRYIPEAAAITGAADTPAGEFERRTRVAAGTWQGVLTHLSLIDPDRPWQTLAFVSHRLLRSIVLPALLPIGWVGAGAAARRHPVARALFLAQTGGYGAAALALVVDSRVLAAPFEFVLTNAATLRGGWRYLTGRQSTTWTRAGRSTPP